MIYRILLGLLVMLGIIAAQANPATYMWTYPSSVPIKSDMNLFAGDVHHRNPQTKQYDHLVGGQFIGMILKVAQINSATNYQIFNKSCGGKGISPFFNGCIVNHNQYRDDKDNFIALIQLVQSASNPKIDNIPLSGPFADKLARAVIASDVKHYFSGFMLDIETLNQPMTKGRVNFFKMLFDKLDGTGLPVGLYINPNTTDFTDTDAKTLNPLIVSGSYYLIPVYWPKTSTSSLSKVIAKISSPFKFSVDVNINPAKQLAMIKPFVSNKCYYGLQIYQYAHPKGTPFVGVSAAYLQQITEFIKAHPAKPRCR